MAYFLFVDESGIDRKSSPYEVLAGICVQDTRVWNLITAIHQAETEYFGQRISKGYLELKARKLLKAKTFRLANELDPIFPEERTSFVREFLQEGQAAKRENRECKITKPQLVALGQAKIAFCKKVFEICAQQKVNAFASIVDNNSPRPEGDFLRKDYSYLFERFYYFLEDQEYENQGVVVFDELERSKCNVLIDQMSRYFKKLRRGGCEHR